MNTSCRVAIVVLAAFGVSALAFAAELDGVDKTTGCRFRIPDGWNFPVVHWTGECKDKIANGSGVLRAFQDGKAAKAYYGSLLDGELDIGVIDDDGGYIAGRFVKGKILDSEDPSYYLKAFHAASAAATQASKAFQLSGNKASAKFYSDMAKHLDEQMGD